MQAGFRKHHATGGGFWGFARRVMVYLWETYPPPPAAVLACLQFFTLYFLAFWVHDTKNLVITPHALTGVTTCFLFMLFLRVADELKDVEVDTVMFPDRPLPSGRVLESDLWIVLIVTLQTLFLLNMAYPGGLMAFLALIVFALLTFRYFFLPELIANNLLLAFLTHNPLTLLTGLYILSIPSNGFSWSILRLEPVLLAVWFWFFGIIWEFTRKIRAPEQETTYVTYSRLFGLRPALAVTFALMATQFGIIVFLSTRHPLPPIPLGLLGVILAVAGLFLGLFPSRPEPRRYTVLQVGAFYLFANLVILLLTMLAERSLTWQSAPIASGPIFRFLTAQ